MIIFLKLVARVLLILLLWILAGIFEIFPLAVAVMLFGSMWVSFKLLSELDEWVEKDNFKG